jgi:hypothetical protein
MSLHDCIQRAIDSGDLPPALARRAQAKFAERLKAHAALGQGAEAMAAEDTWIYLRRDSIRKRRGAYMQAKVQMEQVEGMARHRDSDGQPSAASYLRQLVEWGQSSKATAIRATQEFLEQSYLRDVSDLVMATKRNTLTGGTSKRTKALTANIVRELKNQHTGDLKAKDFAVAVKTVIERARREANAAGAEIGKLEGYDLPHHWNRQKVASVSADEFARDMYDEQDWARIIDRDTEQPFSASTREARIEFLKRIHEGIRTGGMSTREPSGQMIGSSLGKRHADHRVLHFNTPDGWLKMDAKYGDGDPLAAIMGHLSVMARDTAIMRTLGPNPRATLEYLRQAGIKLAQDRPWKPNLSVDITTKRVITAYSSPAQEMDAVFTTANRMLDLVTGAANRAEMDMLANFMGNTIQPMLVASQLGGAMLSAVGDVGFVGMAARHVGVKPSKVITRMLANVAGSLTDTAVNLATLGQAERATVTRKFARLGIISESLVATGVAQGRMVGDHGGPGFWQNMSELTMRASGLTAWTDIGRATFKSESYGFLAENADRAWDQIDPWLRDNLLGAAGITADEWDIIRATPLMEHPRDPQATFLIPDDIRRRTDLDPDQALTLAIKLGGAIENQKEFAVPSASLRARAAMHQAKPGTAMGELQRSVLMYKNYPLTLMQNQLGRVLFHKVRGNRFGNIAMFATVTTLAGALSLTLKDFRDLKDPRDMTEGRFWKAALIQGGGLGLFGDFLYSTENRFGGGWATSIGGPIVGFLDNSGSLLVQGGNALASGDPEQIDAFQRDLIKFADRFAGPTNLWYLSAAIDRWFWDNLTEWADPEAHENWARDEKRRASEYGNKSNWPRGQLVPNSLPDLSAALGGATQ